MKTPLRYQITEFDCGTVSLVNCISFLFEREEIPAELIKEISIYTLDCYDDKGNLGQGGTSRAAVKQLSEWMQAFSAEKNLGVSCKYFKGKNVDIEKIKNCINSGGCVNLRSYLIDTEHYVMITNIDDKFVYMFDPYYLEKDYFQNCDKDISLIEGEKYAMNRKVGIDYFNSAMENQDLTLGPINKREILLINKS